MGGSSDFLPVLEINGASFDDFEGFQHEFSRLLDDDAWAGNLDAFNDILRGGFGTPVGGWCLRWLNSDRSRHVLGHSAMTAYWERILLRCHPTNRPHVQRRLDDAKRGIGPTLFDEIVQIIRSHGPREARNVMGSCWNCMKV